jgi:hypothetical protein
LHWILLEDHVLGEVHGDLGGHFFPLYLEIAATGGQSENFVIRGFQPLRIQGQQGLNHGTRAHQGDKAGVDQLNPVYFARQEQRQ